MMMANGHVYVGEWEKGEKCGNGLYYENNSQVVYKGEWK
jgi:hypothetical protein